jgi:hypothetical protein
MQLEAQLCPELYTILFLLTRLDRLLKFITRLVSLVPGKAGPDQIQAQYPEMTRKIAFCKKYYTFFGTKRIFQSKLSFH